MTSSLSIESIAKSLLIPSSHGPSNPVSQSDFVDRILRSNNVSLSQFSKATICRIIKDQTGLIDLDSAESLLDELGAKFPHDDVVINARQCIETESVRRAAADKNRLRQMRRLDEDASLYVARKQPSSLSSRINERITNSLQPPPFGRRVVNTNSPQPTPLDRRGQAPPFSRRLVNNENSGFLNSGHLLSRLKLTPKSVDHNYSRLSVRTPLTDIFRDLSSSSSSEPGTPPRRRRGFDRIRSLQKLRFLRRWHANILSRRNHLDGAIYLGCCIERLLKRKAFSCLFWSAAESIRRDESIEESTALVALRSSLRIKSDCFDTWRHVFSVQIEGRRRQVEGLWRLVNALSRKMLGNMDYAVASLSLHASVIQRCVNESESIKIIRKILKKKIGSKFSEFLHSVSVGSIQRELTRMKRQSALDILGKALSRVVNSNRCHAFNRIRIQVLAHSQRRQVRQTNFDAWRRATGHADTKRQAISIMTRIIKRAQLRVKFNLLKNCSSSSRPFVRGLAKLNSVFASRTLKPAMTRLQSHSSRLRRLSSLIQLDLGPIVYKQVGGAFDRMKTRASQERVVDAFAKLMTFSRVRDQKQSQKFAFNSIRSFSREKSLMDQVSSLSTALEHFRENEDKLVSEVQGLRSGTISRISLEADLESMEREMNKRAVLTRYIKEWNVQVGKRKQLGRLVAALQRIRRRDFQNAFSCLKQRVIVSLKQQHALSQFVRVSKSIFARNCSLNVWRRSVAIERPEFTDSLMKRAEKGRLRAIFSDWNRLKSRLRSLRVILISNRTRSLQLAFSRLKEHDLKSELIEALRECDSWNMFVCEKARQAGSVVDRLSTSRNDLLLQLVVNGWHQIANQKRSKMIRMAVIVAKSSKRFGFGFLKRDANNTANIAGGVAKLRSVTDRHNVRALASAMHCLNVKAFQRTVSILERISRSEQAQQEAAMRDMEAAARELEADYSSVHSRSRTLELRNEELENEVVVKSSQLERESREVEMLLIKLKEAKEVELEHKNQMDRLKEENILLGHKALDMNRLQEIIRDQEIKLNEFGKISASIPFFKTKISLQNEQIMSLQGKLRESVASPSEDVLYSSPINTRSQDMTYASSSLRGLQQAVDRSSALRAARLQRTSDISLISGDSTNRRQHFSHKR